MRYIGLDVHAETIAVAVAEPDGEVRSLGAISNEPGAIRRLVRKLGGVEGLRICYEAGPCGYVLYWQLTALGAACEVIAPTLVPERAGDRVKTDRRDAMKLARSYRSGDLTPVWVPDAAHEALRDVVRAREAAKKDQLRARHRLGKFLLRRGRRRPEGMSAWGTRHLAWIKTQHFEHGAQEATLLDYLTEVEHVGARIERLERSIETAAEHAPEKMRRVIAGLQALRGVAKIASITVVSEVGDLTRFRRPRQLMGYSGAVSREYSSGDRTHRGAITKTGNAHLRRVAVESAWSYTKRPSMYRTLQQRQQGLSEEVKAIAWKAQHRLCSRYWRLVSRGKPKQQAVTAVARELLGFMWAIAVQCEKESLATTQR